ncbi:MAG: DUF3570 domain-containing protein [Proteobacteria bacterium]|jgi:hypothetical protein|nr:DUF3570 domain-containing protein [Pseudomonadota bacterium]
MQLNDRGAGESLRAGLMAATCALLAPVARAQAPSDDPTQIDTGLLYYQEDGGRVRSIGAIVKLNRDLGDERVLGAQIAVDSLTGGSPNGAVAQKSVQTFATPSGSSLTQTPRRGDDDDHEQLYTIAAGRQPLDTSFHDLRVAGDLSWTQPVGIGNKLSVGAHLSKEYDFISASANGMFSHDFNNRNTTLGVGASAEFDQVKAVGGTPLPGTSYALFRKQDGAENKRVYGAQLGLTQVMARNWITQLNLSVDRSTGYLNDPYKILSQVNAGGVTTDYWFENRPDTHTRRSAYLGNKLALGRSVLDVAYRYGTDDWGIDSHTVTAKYRLRVGGSAYIEPQLRWYRQGAADFYSLFLTSAPTGFMSADPRLAAFTAKTVGLKLGLPLAGGGEVGLRLEGYQQDPKVRSSSLAGLSGLDLNPRLRAVVLQLDWRFGF